MHLERCHAALDVGRGTHGVQRRRRPRQYSSVAIIPAWTESRANLPPGASITIVPRAIHAHFGDCGTQAGDGNATVDRAQAQAAIVAASLALLEETA